MDSELGEERRGARVVRGVAVARSGRRRIWMMDFMMSYVSVSRVSEDGRITGWQDGTRRGVSD